MSAKKTVGRSELSCEVGDGLLDIDEILNRDSWYQIDDFVQRNLLQEILTEFNELLTLDPERAPEEQKKKQRAARSKRTARTTAETSVETKASNAKAGGSEKLKDKIEKPSTNKKKNGEKSGDSGKIEKKKQAASRKGAGKSAMDQNGQGNSPTPSTSSTVVITDDVPNASVARTWIRSSVLANITETTEGASEMASQDALGYSFETSVPQGESSRIDMESTVVATSGAPESNENHSAMTADEEKTILINGGDKGRENKSLRRSSRQNSGGEVGLEVTPDNETLQEHELEETTGRRKQPTRKPKGLKQDVVDGKDIATVSGEKRVGRKSSVGSKSSKERENVEIVADETASTSREESKAEKRVGRKSSAASKSSVASKSSKERENVEIAADETALTSREESKADKRRGRKSLRVTKWLEDQSRLEEQISGDEELSGQSRAKRRSLDTSKSSQENIRKIAEGNISHEKPDVQKKRGRKSLRRSICSEEQHPAEKETSDDGEFSGQTKAKRRSLQTSKSSKQDAEKIAEEKSSISRGATAAEEERVSWSLGVQCSEGVTEETTRRRSLRVSKSSKEDAAKTSKQNISNEEPEGENKRKKRLSKCSNEVSPVGKQLPQDRKQSAEDTSKRRSLRVSKDSKQDAEKSLENNVSTSQEEANVELEEAGKSMESRKEKQIGKEPEKKNALTGQKESNGEKQKEKSKCTEQEKKPAEVKKESGWRSLGIPQSWLEKKKEEKSAKANTSNDRKESDGEKQKEKSKCTEQQKKPADVENERAMKSLGTSRSWEEKKNDEQPDKKNRSIEKKRKGKSRLPAEKGVPKGNEDSDVNKKAEGRCSRSKNSPKKEDDRKPGWKKTKRNKSATKEKKVSRYQKMLLEKKKRRKERRIERHERKANRAMEEFTYQVASIAKKMGYVQESQSDSSDSSSDFSDSSSPSESDETEDSSISSGSSVCSGSCSCCTYGTDDCSCSSPSSCSGCGDDCTDPNCHCATPCSCIDFSDSSDDYSVISD